MTKAEINLKIDDLTIKTRPGITLLQAALENDIYIPHLCHHPDLKPWGACRLCFVENQEGRLVPACEIPVEEGMEIVTENKRLNRIRKSIAELLIANHEVDCLTCSQNNNCKLQEIAAYLDIQRDDLGNLRKQVPDIQIDDSNPFFNRDLKKCIVCGICVRVCSEIMGTDAVDFGFRGYDTKITTFGDKPILESSCVSCGECVVACPVGALVPKENSQPAREVKTVCTYCGVGCNLYLGVRGNEIVNVRADRDNAVNKGNLCVKGRYGYGFINSPKRLKSPLIKRNGQFEEVTWDEALSYVAENLSKYGSEEFGAISSARCTNEDNYVLQKFTRVVMGSNNVDNCARSCHAPSVAGLAGSIGSGAMTNSIDEIADAGCLLVIGTNPTCSYPVISMRIVEAVKNGAKLIVADPRTISLCKHAELVLNHNPGSDVALLMGMMKVIVDENLFDEEFVKERTENFEEFRKSLEEFPLSLVGEITGVDEDKIREAARLYAKTKPASILYSLGITEHTHGTDNVFALSNLALLTGNVGKPSTGVNPLRGQNNVQGSCDMGCLPDVFPGYQKVTDSASAQKFKKAWNSDLDESLGLKFPEMLESAKQGRVKAMYIVGENPVTSEPDSKNVVNSLENLEFLVVQDIFLTETAQMADAVLPGCSFAEKDGTFTNTERRVQRVRKAIEPIGDSKPDWWITCEVARNVNQERGTNATESGSEFAFKDPSEIFEELSSLAPIFEGISYPRLENEGLQWPCTDEGDEGTPILHTQTFATETGRGKFSPLKYRPSAELPDAEYPLLLTTGRNLYHYHGSSMTGAVEGLKKLSGKDFIDMNPEDALKLGIEDGEIVKVISRRGEVKSTVKVTDICPQGVVYMTFHFAETSTNLITNSAGDSITKTPEFKVCAVRVEKLDTN